MSDKLSYTVTPGKALLARMPLAFTLRTEPPADFDQTKLKAATLTLTEDQARELKADGYEVKLAATGSVSAPKSPIEEPTADGDMDKKKPPAATGSVSAPKSPETEAVAPPAPEASAAPDPVQADTPPRRRKPEPSPDSAL